MAPHHEAWLSAHPGRTREWLSRMLSDGFDVHHLDSDHSNNDPNNLVLIEADDHQRLHGASVRTAAKRQAAKDRTHASGREFYERRARGEKWSDIADDALGSRLHSARAMGRAKLYAMATSREWPVPGLS